MTTTDPVLLTKQLVNIPSFVDKTNNESEIGRFIERYLTKIFPYSTVKRQMVENNRFNLLFGNVIDPDLVIAAHIDTVRPQKNWLTDPFKGIIKDDKVFGLGTADMKGSIGSFLAALTKLKGVIDDKRIMVLFYIDEEYDFKGMKTFVKKIPFKKAPQLTLSLDGDLLLSSGCRGCIEVAIQIKGKSGHSSRPYSGVNTITRSTEMINLLEKDFASSFDTYLGVSTVNLAYIQGGSLTYGSGQAKLQREGNIIPDFVDLTFEVRPSTNQINSSIILKKIKELARMHKLDLIKYSCRHNLNPWIPSYETNVYEKIKTFYNQCQVSFSQKNNFFGGYIDIALLVEKIKTPTFVIGAGGSNYHAPNEYVPIDNLFKAQKIYEEIIKSYCSKRLK